MIEIKDLNFSYGRQQVLYDINVNLAEETITGLVGPNGAGKSTLMRCIAGLEIPQFGEVYINGKVVLDNPQKSYAQMGYLPDIFGLPNRLSVAQCWAYSAKARGVSDKHIPASLHKTAEVLNLQEKLFEPVGSLSRGMQQRVGIGQVIIHRPKLLILDEPAGGLDPEARYELSCLFKKLREQGMTLLVSSHILAELDEYCTHMLVLDKGRIRQHSAVNGQVSGSLNTGKQAVVLRFSALDEAVWNVVRQAPQLSDIRVEGNSVIAQIDADEQERVALIRYLASHNVPLTGVEPLKESMLVSYRRSLEQGKV